MVYDNMSVALTMNYMSLWNYLELESEKDRKVL